MFDRLNEDEWDDEYTVKSLKEFLNSSYIDDDFPVRLGISEWNFSKSCNFFVRQVTSFGKPFVCLESMEINNDYNEIYDKWIDKKIENNKLKIENKELKDKNSQLQETLAFRSNQLALMERLVDDLGSEEMARKMEEILND